MNAETMLRRICDAYDNLQKTDGACVVFSNSDTYTAGQWLGSRMEGLIIKAREVLADDDKQANR